MCITQNALITLENAKYATPNHHISLQKYQIEISVQDCMCDCLWVLLYQTAWEIYETVVTLTGTAW